MSSTDCLPNKLGTDIERAAQIVRNGGLIVFPTDTVYGLGADPRQPDAVRRLVATKGRPEGKGLPILVANSETVTELVIPNPLITRLALAFWPGALTIVTGAQQGLHPLLLGPGHTVGIRVPASRMTRRLIRLAGSFLIGTSANISGQTAATNAREAYNNLGGSVDYVVDGGHVDSPASTVIDITTSPPSILRSGSISEDELSLVVSQPG